MENGKCSDAKTVENGKINSNIWGKYNRKYAVHSTFITTYGLAYNEYCGAFQQVITLENLFS